MTRFRSASPRRPAPARALAAALALALLASSLPAGLGRAQEGSPEGARAADTTPPSIARPDDLLVAAVDASGADVAYALPAAADETDGAVDVACAPASGSRFPLGATTVGCTATDDAGNAASTSFVVTVADMTVPAIPQPPDIVADAVAGANPAVSFSVGATDNVDGAIGTACAPPSGSAFPVGTTVVTCTAVDAAGNAASVAFTVVVNPPPATATPVPTSTPQPTSTPVPPAPTDTPRPRPTETPRPPRDATSTPRPTETPSPTATPSPTPTPTRVDTPVALALPWPPPESFTLDGDGGPLGPLAMIWGNVGAAISQEFGHTWFSVRTPGWYDYGRAYGLDGREHTGLDVGMPRGTPIYSPVSGTVLVAGGTPYFTFYGNGLPGVGELTIRTDDGHLVVLGHMGAISVVAGQRVEYGQFVGVSGGENGDHLHLEVRVAQRGGGHLIVDPRKSFLVAVIEDAQAALDGKSSVASSRRSDEADTPEGTPQPDDDPEERGGPS